MINKYEFNQELSEYLRLLRFKHRKSQEDMGKLIGVARNTYSIWERRPIVLPLDTIIKIGDLLGENVLIFFSQYVAKSNEKRGV